MEKTRLENLDGILLVDSQDVGPVNEEFQTDYDGFIVAPDYKVWGFYGVPYKQTWADFVGNLEV